MIFDISLAEVITREEMKSPGKSLEELPRQIIVNNTGGMGEN
jgi:hypothetical protein